MKRVLKGCLSIVAMSLLCAGVAQAWSIDGHVYCSEGALPLPGVEIDVTLTSVDPAYHSVTFNGSATTDENGYYKLLLPEGVPACYRATIVLKALQSAVNPSSGEFNFCLSDAQTSVTENWTILTPNCGTESGACWLTGGGAKFSSITGTDLGESSKKHNWGGNVNPGCSPTAGDGGSWNDIDAVNKRHFHGTHIEVVRCGNVSGIPPGSTSPVTPFNFIEFTGWGTLKGIQGNKEDFGKVYFFARAEDRNEPGSSGQRDGAGKDRYFLNVYTEPGNPTGTSKLLVDLDGDPSTVDPLIITDGNMQIHISSCDNPIVLTAGARPATGGTEPLTPAAMSWGSLKLIYR